MDIRKASLPCAFVFVFLLDARRWPEEKDDRQILRLNMDSDGIERFAHILIPLKESSRIHKGDQGDTLMTIFLDPKP
jgi:hypothetical protein